MTYFGITDKTWVTGNLLPCDRCRDGPGLNLDATRLFRRIQQKLAAAKINGSRPFTHAKNSFLAKACDRLILESQLTPGLDIGLRHSRAPANQNTAQNHPGLCWNFFRVESPA